MKNYISVNAKYYKSNAIIRISEHNNRESNIDYLLDEKDIKYKNQDIVYNSSFDDTIQNVNISCGTYEENLANWYKSGTVGNNSINLKHTFYKSLHKKQTTQKANGYHNNKSNNTNELVECVVALSEEQALYYIENGIDIMIGFDNLALKIKEKYGFEPLGINLHLDEGYKDKQGNIKLNIHAHLILHNFNFTTGKTILRTMRKEDWKDIQDLAQIAFQEKNLDFVRGESKDITNTKHLERNQFILLKQDQELSQILNTLQSKQKELKELYSALNAQKNTLKEIRKQVDKNSNIYKVLSTNIKTLQLQEKETREKHRILKNELKSKQDQLNIIEEKVENQDTWIKETKEGLKAFLKEHTTKTSNKYQINDINSFYDELVDLAIYLSNYDIKIEELDTLKANNTTLKDKLQNLKNADTKNIQNLQDLQEKLDIAINTKNQLDDENYYLKKYISNQNLDDDYNSFVDSLNNQNEHDKDNLDI